MKNHKLIICILAIIVLLSAGSGVYYVMQRNYHINKEYSRLFEYIENTKKIDSGIIEYTSEGSKYVGIQKFNGDNLRATQISVSTSDYNSGFYRINYMLFNNIAYYCKFNPEGDDGTWRVSDKPFIFAGMGEFIKEYFLLPEQKEIASIKVYHDEEDFTIINVVAEYKQQRKEAIEYTVNPYGIITRINVKNHSKYNNEYYANNYFEAMFYPQEVIIENPFDYLDEKENLLAGNLDLDGDDLPDSITINKSEYKHIFNLDFNFGNSEICSIYNIYYTTTPLQIEAVGLSGSGKNNIILLMDSGAVANGGKLLILNKKNSEYTEWNTPFIYPDHETENIKYSLTKTDDKYTFELYRYSKEKPYFYSNDYVYVKVFSHMIDCSDIYQKNMGLFDRMYENYILGGDVDSNIYKFELIENNVNGYDIRIYQRVYLMFYSETIGYVTTDIRYDENGEYTVVNSEFVDECTPPQYDPPVLSQ